MDKATKIEVFFEDLEAVLQKHLHDDWKWQYKDGFHTLSIVSGKLVEIWEEDIKEKESA